MRKNGHSANAKYAKSFSDSTDLQLLAYRYQSKGYIEFADFDATDRYARNNKKARYEMRFSQRLGDVNLSLFGWRENYWWLDGNATGGISHSVARYLVMYRCSCAEATASNPIWISLITVLPSPLVCLSIWGVRYYSSTGMNYSSHQKMGMTAGVSANPTDRFSYGLNTSLNEKGDRNLSGNVSYGFDAIQTRLMLTQGRHQTSVSGSVSGTALGTPESGVLLTKETGNTLGIVRMPNVAGVRFNRSAPTNRKGYTVVNLSDYTLNRINVDMENVPDDLELQTTSYNVVPTEKAVVYRQFGAKYVQRYILRVKDRNGKILDGGSARTEQGLDAGFIANNGVLLMNLLSAPTWVKVTLDKGSTCRFSMSGIQADANKVQEVRCE